MPLQRTVIYARTLGVYYYIYMLYSLSHTFCFFGRFSRDMINDCRSKTLVWHFRGRKTTLRRTTHHHLSPPQISPESFRTHAVINCLGFPIGLRGVCVCVRARAKEYTWSTPLAAALPWAIFKTNTRSRTHIIRTRSMRKRTSIISRWTTPRAPINDTRPEIEVFAVYRAPTVRRRPRGYRPETLVGPEISSATAVECHNPFLFDINHFSDKLIK
jgi:hypothetical protein